MMEILSLLEVLCVALSSVARIAWHTDDSCFLSPLLAVILPIVMERLERYRFMQVGPCLSVCQ